MSSSNLNGNPCKNVNIKSNSFSNVTNGEGKVPEWLKAEIFLDVLNNNVPDFKQIINFKAKPALSAGENYATLMLHVEIEVELGSGVLKNLSYMLKVPIEAMKQIMSKLNVFETETLMYNTIVPELEQLYRDADIEVKFSANMYALETPSEFGVVLLEDLRLRGFKNTNRLEGLDMEHIKCVLRKLAQWHAASAVRVERKGEYPVNLVTGFFTDDHHAIMNQMQEAMSKIFMKCIKTFKGHDVYIKNLEKYQERFIEEFFNAGKIDPSDFNVLNHGDCWSNNIMFQYDAFGKIKETYLVDYQIPKYGSPAQDIFYFLISSAKHELKLKHFDLFIKIYHDNLIESLKLLKYSKKIPSLKEIHMSLYKYGVWGYSTMTGVMAAVLVDPTEDASIENFLGDTEAGNNFKILMYSNKRYRKNAEAILPWLYYRGTFDC